MPALRGGPIRDHRHGSDADADFLSFRLAVGGTNCRRVRGAGRQQRHSGQNGRTQLHWNVIYRFVPEL